MSNRKHRRDTRVLGATRVEGLLILLVESGVAYCVLWVCPITLHRSTRLMPRNGQIFLLGSQIAWITSPSGLGATSWSTGMVYFTEGCLIAFVVRGLPDSPHACSCIDDPPVGHIPDPHHRPRRSQQVPRRNPALGVFVAHVRWLFPSLSSQPTRRRGPYAFCVEFGHEHD